MKPFKTILNPSFFEFLITYLYFEFCCIVIGCCNIIYTWNPEKRMSKSKFITKCNEEFSTIFHKHFRATTNAILFSLSAVPATIKMFNKMFMFWYIICIFKLMFYLASFFSLWGQHTYQDIFSSIFTHSCILLNWSFNIK